VIDEASWVDDEVFKNGISPMLTDNAKCQLILLSTPNGRQGFFWRAFCNPRWERYEVRSPWEVDDAACQLVKDIPEAEYQRRRAADRILAWYSPRHGHVPPRPPLSAEEAEDLEKRATHKKSLAEDEEERERGKASQQERLEDGGPRNYRQEFRCEFVEPEGQVFAYDEIEAMSGANEQPLDLAGIPISDDLPLVVGQ
jgi:hypothetical protein